MRDHGLVGEVQINTGQDLKKHKEELFDYF